MDSYFLSNFLSVYINSTLSIINCIDRKYSDRYSCFEALLPSEMGPRSSP